MEKPKSFFIAIVFFRGGVEKTTVFSTLPQKGCCEGKEKKLALCPKVCGYSIEVLFSLTTKVRFSKTKNSNIVLYIAIVICSYAYMVKWGYNHI